MTPLLEGGLGQRPVGTAGSEYGHVHPGEVRGTAGPDPNAVPEGGGHRLSSTLVDVSHHHLVDRVDAVQLAGGPRPDRAGANDQNAHEDPSVSGGRAR